MPVLPLATPNSCRNGSSHPSTSASAIVGIFYRFYFFTRQFNYGEVYTCTYNILRANTKRQAERDRLEVQRRLSGGRGKRARRVTVEGSGQKALRDVASSATCPDLCYSGRRGYPAHVENAAGTTGRPTTLLSATENILLKRCQITAWQSNLHWLHRLHGPHDSLCRSPSSSRAVF